MVGTSDCPGKAQSALTGDWSASSGIPESAETTVNTYSGLGSLPRLPDGAVYGAVEWQERTPS